MVDDFLKPSLAQAVTSSAVSTNTIDLGVARDLGSGEELNFSFTVDVAATAAGAATVTFQVISSAAAALTSPTILTQTDAIGKAELTAGRKPIVVPIARAALISAQALGQRYLGAQYTVATGPLTAGSFTCYLVIDAQDVNKNYPSGFSVT